MATLKDDDDQDQDTTGQNVEVEEEQRAEPEDNTEVVEDERLAADQDDGENADETEEDEEEHSRRKESARERRRRAKEAKQRDKEELALLRATIAKQDQRLNQTERALIETRITDYDNRAATAQSYVNQWNEVDIKATKAGNVADAQAARQYRDQAAKEAAEYARGAAELKATLTGGRQQQQQQPPAFAGMAVDFLKDKPWYNPKSGDEDSLIVEALDKALMNKMNPNTPQYWAELDRRVKARLPHKFAKHQDDDADDEDDDMADDDSQETTRQQSTQRRKGPPTGGSSRSTSSRNPKEIRLPPQMVEAMKEAGQWDDLKKRQRVAKRYAEQLRNNRG